MSVLIYRPKDNGFEKDMCEPEVLHTMITDGGWYLSTDDFPNPKEIESEESEDVKQYEDMENSEIRALAKAAGIENHDDAWIKTLIKKLRDIDDNEG